jgi:hypothetical protein
VEHYYYYYYYYYYYHHPRGKGRRGRPDNTWKDGIRDSMQRKNLKDEEYSDRELWRKKILWVEENCVFTEKFLYNIYDYY